MGFLHKLFGGGPSEMELKAPVAGEAVPISEVSDPTFGDEILGKGIAIRPTGNQICAPCDGTIDMMFETGHAVSMTGVNGAEILIHVGLETVSLKGKHFTVHAANGDTVKAGQPLIGFDRETIAAEGFDMITPMVICNSDHFKEVRTYTGSAVSVGDKVIGLVK